MLGSNQLSPARCRPNWAASIGWRCSLDDNQLSGSLPPEMADMARLGLLVLRGNNLSGEIPKEFDGLTLRPGYCLRGTTSLDAYPMF